MKNDWIKWLNSLRWARLRRKRFVFLNQREEFQSCQIGDWTYGNPDILKWDDATELKIGKFCSIAKGVRILVGGEHHLNWVTTYPLDLFLDEPRTTVRQPATKGDVTIGNDVWIGTNTIILSGVKIGDGAAIGAGSVVTRDIPPYTIAAGNPAKAIRKRFEEPVIQTLLVIKWWDWPIEQIKEAIPLLMSDNMNDFLAKYAPQDSVRCDETEWAPHKPSDNQSAL